MIRLYNEIEFNLLSTSNNGLGTAASIWLSTDSQIILKEYSKNYPTISGNHTKLNNFVLDILFRNEVNSLNLLTNNNCKLFPKIIQIDIENRIILQEYTGPNLLDCGKKLPIDDIIKSYYENLNCGFLKCNGAKSNFTYDGKTIKAIDFKWCRKRTEKNLKREINNIFKWLTKIDKTLPFEIKKYYSDFNPKLVEELYNSHG